MSEKRVARLLYAEYHRGLAEGRNVPVLRAAYSGRVRLSLWPEELGTWRRLAYELGFNQGQEERRVEMEGYALATRDVPPP